MGTDTTTARKLLIVDLSNGQLKMANVDSEYGFDLENRDPLDKNPHVRTLYEDALGEPEGTNSIDGVWSCSYKTYNGSERWCYISLVSRRAPTVSTESGRAVTRRTTARSDVATSSCRCCAEARALFSGVSCSLASAACTSGA